MLFTYYQYAYASENSNSFWLRCRCGPSEFWRWATTSLPAGFWGWTGPTALRQTTQIAWSSDLSGWTSVLGKTFHFCRSDSAKGCPTSCCPCYDPSSTHIWESIHPRSASSCRPNSSKVFSNDILKTGFALQLFVSWRVERIFGFFGQFNWMNFI